jgi:two-component system, OmpR family, alkaline phosphatase synthesis response regulator PhoP
MKRVLLVDDENAVRDVIKHIFEDEGYEVMTANNGTEGLLCVQTAKPHLIITDLMMPSMNGVKFCRSVQAVPEYRIIPIILVSAVSDRVESKGCNWAAVIHKPFELDVLIATVAHLLGTTAA